MLRVQMKTPSPELSLFAPKASPCRPSRATVRDGCAASSARTITTNPTPPPQSPCFLPLVLHRSAHTNFQHLRGFEPARSSDANVRVPTSMTLVTYPHSPVFCFCLGDHLGVVSGKFGWLPSGRKLKSQGQDRHPDLLKP